MKIKPIIRAHIKPIVINIYWAARAITEKNDSLGRLLQNAYLAYGKNNALLKLMESQLSPGNVIYDIGAFVGLFSIVLAKKSDSCLIYSFEPNPESYARLTKNIRLMKMEGRIVSCDIALGSGIGKRTLYVSSTSARSSMHTYRAEYNGNKIIDNLLVDCFTISTITLSFSSIFSHTGLGLTFISTGDQSIM